MFWQSSGNVVLLLFLVAFFPSSVESAATAQTKSIPVIDLGAWTSTTTDPSSLAERHKVVKQVGRACRVVGFFAIRNHGVNVTRLEALWTAARDFFDLPFGTKLQSKTHNETDYPYGYEQSETLVVGKKLDQQDENSRHADSSLPPPDPKETFSLGPYNPLAGMPPRRFPKEPPELKQALTEYYHEMESLASTLLQLFALALDLPQDWFHDKMTRHMSALRLLNYFPITTNNNTNGAIRIRAGAHTDYGALTILKPGAPGLQVQWRDGQWIHVPYIPDAFVVNLGDLMQRWTNDRWVSTLHRVVGVRGDDDDKGGQQRRQSIAYFCNVNGDTPVETLETCIDENHPRKYPRVLAKDHLMAKHLASMRLGSTGGSSSETKTGDTHDDEL